MPDAAILDVGQFSELLAQEVAARNGLFTSPEEPQASLLRRLKVERVVPPQAMDLFHRIRIAGNQAAHAQADDHALALTTLKITRQVAIWFHKTYGKKGDLRIGPFVPPPEPEDVASPMASSPPRARRNSCAKSSSGKSRSGRAWSS